jgi:peptidoglycan/LPS O-acetylase OafA/YrhL
VWGGRVSFSLYMTHFPVLIAFSALIPLETMANASTLQRVAALLGLFAAMSFVAAFTYALVEEPARRRLVGRLGRSD